MLANRPRTRMGEPVRMTVSSVGKSTLTGLRSASYRASRISHNELSTVSISPTSSEKIHMVGTPLKGAIKSRKSTSRYSPPDQASTNCVSRYTFESPIVNVVIRRTLASSAVPLFWNLAVTSVGTPRGIRCDILGDTILTAVILCVSCANDEHASTTSNTTMTHPTFRIPVRHERRDGCDRMPNERSRAS